MARFLSLSRLVRGFLVGNFFAHETMRHQSKVVLALSFFIMNDFSYDEEDADHIFTSVYVYRYKVI